MKNNYSYFHSNKFALLVFGLLSTFGVSAQFFEIGSGNFATDVSSDGTVVVGDNGSQYFMWTEATGLMLIGGVAPQGFGGQACISGDATIVAGTRINPNNNLGELSSYEVSTQTWTSHGSLGSSSGNSASSGWGISQDGSTIVGLGWISAGSAHAIKYTSAGGIEDLGSTVSGRSTRANAASGDGEIIAGWQDATSGFRQGAIWENGVQTLITHPNSDPATEVGALSADGNWAGGGQGFGNNFQAWKWSEATGIVDIGPAPVSGWRGAITGLNQDGSVAVGFYRPFNLPATFGEGFIHNDTDGIVYLNDLATSLGIDTQGFTLALPLAISDDGSTIVGVTNGGRGFVLRIPAGASNNNCSNAIALNCDDVVTGNTEDATDSGGNASPDVFYSYTGSGVEENITISLCDGGTNFDSVLRVYEDCGLSNEIAINDDFCGSQSELTFESDGTSTYYIMVEGSGTAAGNFSLEITCEEDLGIDSSKFAGLQFYPNPVKDKLYINNHMQIDAIRIQSITGQNILNLQPNMKEFHIDLSSLNSGIYLVTLEIEGVIRNLKVVK